MEQLILDLVLQNPKLASVVVVIGILRAVFKPIQNLLLAYVEATPGLEDNEKFAKLQASKGYKVFAWFLDYTASIKVPVKKE